MVMDNPFLYDKSNSDFKDIKKKDRVWNTIGKQFNMTDMDAKNLFKSLREKYLRIKKNIKNDTRSGAGALKEKDWHIFKLISFLEEIIRSRKTIASFKYESTPQSTVFLSRIKVCENDMNIFADSAVNYN
ncbi:hypothetical protein ABEB36_009264 [Hypothenemus hampei]|uniref:MADF domain-containing protein n=1 Tax=Hypothenemus hampei TaxID=57062 RepID=A0ABD1EFU4_HYPHA